MRNKTFVNFILVTVFSKIISTLHSQKLLKYSGRYKSYCSTVKFLQNHFNFSTKVCTYNFTQNTFKTL